MMMKVSAAAAGALLIVCAGCYSTDLARPPVSQEEKAWEDLIRESYPGYKAPPKTTRLVKGHTESRVSAVIEKKEAEPLADPAEKKDGSATPQELPVEEPAAEAKSEKAAEPAAETAPAEKSAEVKSEKAAEPAAETAPAEKSAEVKSEKAAEPAAETAPAGAKAAEVAPAEKTADAKESAMMPPDPTNSSVYVVKSGDTLGGIAKKNYGNAAYSNIIFKANSDILKNPNKLRPGMKLIIPKL